MGAVFVILVLSIGIYLVVRARRAVSRVSELGSAAVRSYEIIHEIDMQIAHLSDEEKERFWLAFNAEIDDRPEDEQPELIRRAYAYGRGEIERDEIWEGLDEKPDPAAIARKYGL